MTLFFKVAGGIAALYLAAVVVIATLQGALIFPRWATGPSPALPATAERLALKVGSGHDLAGVYLPAEGHLTGEAGLVLGFGGNAWNAEALAILLHSIFPDDDIVAFHYRGYAPSSGSPSAHAILGDALAIHDHLRSRFAPEKIVVIGVSLGAGPAAHVASQRPVAGLILVTPFDSLKAMAREHFPWLPAGLLLRHQMDVAGELTSVSAPVAVIAAGADTIVTDQRTEPVRRAARTLVVDRVIDGAEHNDLFHRPEFRSAMQDALSLIETSRPSEK